MAKKAKSELKSPLKWAKIHNLDPDVFVFWKGEMITEEEFMELKRKQYGVKSNGI